MKKKEFKRFNSFFMGGFECADHINRSGNRINLLHETEHHLRAFEDYELLVSLEIKVVREGVCWSTVEVAPYKFDFRSLKGRIDAASALGIQIIWDLCHFGYPDDMIPTHPRFPERFMSFCRAFILFHNDYTEEPLLVCPVNEISFLSWHSGDMRGTVPFAINSGFDIKYHLCKAVIEGMQVIKQTDSKAKIFVIEPLIKIHSEDPEFPAETIEEYNENQYQALDIIAGSLCPELGGSPELFDMLGFNYYYNNQWTHLDNTLPWPDEKDRLTPLSRLLKIAYSRYSKPIILAETGHFGHLRSQWLEEVTLECDRAISIGVDLQGICIYPVIDRPDWDNLNSYSNCGLWDLDVNKNRIPHEPVIVSLKKCVEMMKTEHKSPSTPEGRALKPFRDEKTSIKN